MKIIVQNLEELKKVVSTHRHVSLIGSGHHYNKIAEAEVQIDIAPLCKILEVDRSSHIVHVESGIKLHELNSILWSKYNMALPSMGDYDEQSLAGIISTCTHGSGYNVEPVSSAVKALEVVLYDGTLLHIKPDAHDLLSLFKCAVGMVAGIYSVWLQCEPAFFLRERMTSVDMAKKTAQNLEVMFKTHEFTEYWLIPHTRKALEITRDKTQDRPCWVRLKMKSLNAKFEKMSLLILIWLSKRYVHWTPKFIKILSKFLWLHNSNVVDRSYRTFPRQRQANLGKHTGPENLVDMEYLIPYEELRIKEIYDTLMNFIDRESKEGRYLDFPIHLRLVKRPKHILLAPFTKERMVSISICIVNSTQQDSALLQNLEQLIITKYPGSVPHWGKIFYTNPLPTYGKHFDAFRAMSLKLDPKDKFLNDEMAHWVAKN